MVRFENAKELFKWLASDELSKEDILNMLTEDMCAELIVKNNAAYLESNGNHYNYHYDGELVGSFKAADIKKVFLLKCLHESRFGADAFASIHSSREDAEKHVETVKFDSGYLDEEGRDDNRFTYDIEEFVLDINSLERAGKSEKIKIDLGFATLVAERGGDPNYNEVFIGLENEEGCWSQDLAIVRQKYHYTKDVPVSEEVVQEKEMQVLVYGDKDNEDYTHEFSIDIYEEENEISEPVASAPTPASQVLVQVFRFDENRANKYYDAIKYWSNACGDLHHHGQYDITKEELPEELRRAYDEVWSENYGSYCYLVETSKGYGIALINEYDNYTAEEAGCSHEELFKLMLQDAKNIAQHPAFKDADIFCGENGGFDSCHELAVVFPASVALEEFDEAGRVLEDLAYASVRELSKPSLEGQMQQAETLKENSAPAGCTEKNIIER